MKKSCKIALWCVGAIVALTAIVGFGAGIYMVGYALDPKIDRDTEHFKAKINDRYPGLKEWMDTLENAGALRDTSLLSEDGLTLHAWIAPSAQPSAKTAIVVHGYCSNAVNMMMIARMYRDSLGYNIIVPHLRRHGISEGESVCMGWKDRLDVIKWSALAHECFEDSLQVVHGISMGGATTMMVSGEQLPEYVKGFVDDCGYTSVWDQFKKELKEDFGLPAFPILYCASMICKLKYGWSFKEASSVNQLAKCEKPMLFIHGDADDYVLTEMVYRNYDAKTQGFKDMWIVPDTDHANSYKNHPAEYTARVRAFLKNEVE